MAILTERQATEKWCPHTRVGMSQGLAANRTGAVKLGLDPDGRGYANIYEETRCLASGCMMWEFVQSRGSPERLGRCGLTMSVDLES